MIGLALAGVLLNGLNFGIEFRGGTEFRVLGVTNTQDYEAKAQDAGRGRDPGLRDDDDRRRQHRPRVQTEAAEAQQRRRAYRACGGLRRRGGAEDHAHRSELGSRGQ